MLSNMTTPVKWLAVHVWTAVRWQERSPLRSAKAVRRREDRDKPKRAAAEMSSSTHVLKHNRAVLRVTNTPGCDILELLLARLWLFPSKKTYFVPLLRMPSRPMISTRDRSKHERGLAKSGAMSRFGGHVVMATMRL